MLRRKAVIACYNQKRHDFQQAPNEEELEMPIAAQWPARIVLRTTWRKDRCTLVLDRRTANARRIDRKHSNEKWGESEIVGLLMQPQAQNGQAPQSQKTDEFSTL